MSKHGNEHKELSLFFLSFSFYLLSILLHYLFLTFLPFDVKVEIADQHYFIVRAEGWLSGLLPYRDFYNNAAPLSGVLWGVMLVASSFVSVNPILTPLFFSYSLRTLFALSLSFSSVLLYRLLENKQRCKRNYTICFIYALNPFFLHLITFFGSDEALVPLFLLLPIYLFETRRKRLAILCIVLGFTLKYWSILTLPLILIYSSNFKDIVKNSLFVLFLFVCSLLPFYFISPAEFLLQFDNPLDERGNQGLLTLLNLLYSFSFAHSTLLFTILTLFVLSLASFYLYYHRKIWSFERIYLIIVTYLFFYPKYQGSYFALLLPFLFVFLFYSLKHNLTIVSLFSLALLQSFLSRFIILSSSFLSPLFILFTLLITAIYFLLLLLSPVILFKKPSSLS